MRSPPTLPPPKIWNVHLIPGGCPGGCTQLELTETLTNYIGPAGCSRCFRLLDGGNTRDVWLGGSGSDVSGGAGVHGHLFGWTGPVWGLGCLREAGDC